MPLFFLKFNKLQWWLTGILLVAPLLVYSQANKTEIVKAALSYNFAKYTQWPEAQQRNEVTFCYFNSAYINGFERLAAKTLNEKKIVVRQVDSVNVTAGCQLIYIDSKDRNKLQRLFLYLKNKPILTVSDMAGFVTDGGMIEIINQDNKLRFKVNLEQLERQGLTISSEVLKLAVQVKKDK
ncbi:MAG: hypothetical protein ACI8VC_001362 [Candidatus Endobugula sp.]|jgi:hypothetical protein